MLQPYTTIIVIFFSSLIYTPYLNDKLKQNFRKVCKFIKQKKKQRLKCIPGASRFSQSLLRCFYTLIGVHLVYK